MAVVSTKTKTGRHWQVRVRDSMGRLFPTKVFARKVDAEAHERALLARRDTGGFAPTPAQRDTTLIEFWSRWSKECRDKVSEGWKMSQDQMFRDHVVPMLGQMKLAEVRSTDIGRTLSWVREKGLAAQTVCHVYTLLHKMFEDATGYYELIPQNPVQKRHRPKVIQRERDFLSVEESWRLLDHSRPHWAGPAVWVSGLSALRAGEVQGLRVKALDFERDRILIQASYNKKTRKMQEHPKQGDWGSVPMIPELKAYLLEVTLGKGPDDFVCPNGTGGMLNYESFCDRVLRRLCKGAGVKRVTPHELRHSCTEIWVSGGASAEDIRRLLNQKSLSATRRYIHRTDDRLNSIAASIKRPERKPDPTPTAPASSAPTVALCPILRVVSSR
jgi:integrase